MARYLMQRPGGFIYDWTPVQSKRPDMVEISEEEAKKHLYAQSRVKVSQPKAVEEPVKAIEIPTEEGQEPDVHDVEPPPVDGDPEIAFLEKIRKLGKGKKEIESYMRQKYGIEIDRTLKVDQLVDQAIEARRKELSAVTPA